MFAITLGSFVTYLNIIYYDHPVHLALRERLRTHKVFTKRTALYLNYPKLSYHVFTSLASHNIMISLENGRFKESSSSPIAFHSSSNLKMLYLKVDYMSPLKLCVYFVGEGP